ncbi:CinA family protein [Pararhizobium sp.]|uniref:CinA family protein n=1 Tax=Pararhizobium sp. TaxID=1977563 RepID=UPI002725525D|nr:CinA family protein [Pararhizobium sp.]MDO9418620.1 CinA family protein [Pararhizobium sp.]
MSMWPADIELLAAGIIDSFIRRGLKVATAESCTGGLIAGALTKIPGSSAVIDRGFVTYSNGAKIDMLSVKAETLADHGAVSEQTAREMVAGALANSKADIAVAVTGIAGPGGGSDEKPVGRVHLAAATCSGALLHRRMDYGDIGRDAVRLETVRTALQMIGEIVQPS